MSRTGLVLLAAGVAGVGLYCVFRRKDEKRDPRNKRGDASRAAPRAGSNGQTRRRVWRVLHRCTPLSMSPTAPATSTPILIPATMFVTGAYGEPRGQKRTQRGVPRRTLLFFKRGSQQAALCPPSLDGVRLLKNSTTASGSFVLGPRGAGGGGQRGGERRKQKKNRLRPKGTSLFFSALTEGGTSPFFLRQAQQRKERIDTHITRGTRVTLRGGRRANDQAWP